MRRPWLDATELRVGLGCMRLSTAEDRSEELAHATVLAAVEVGVTVFDTARAYGRSAGEFGHNERLLARALRDSGAAETARVVTKGGMTRNRDAWIPDGRGKTILADCEASLRDLDGLPIDLYLLHAPDPRTPWGTSIRALARLQATGLVRRVGISNVNRRQLEQALELADVAAVEIAISPVDNRALRGGVVELCHDAGIAVIAHSPLGGARRAKGLGRREVLAEVALAHGSTPAEIAIAWLLDLSPEVVVIPGARRPESVRSAVRAAAIRLAPGDQARLDLAFGRPASGAAQPPSPSVEGDVVMLMGIPGAGKSRLAEEFVTRGYLRLNRDEVGGSLREVAVTLDARLSAGSRRVVLDNTYLTRASRSYVIETAKRHRLATRCIWLDTPLAQAQVNLVERILRRTGSLPSPEGLRSLARTEPGILMPTSQMRAVRELEEPATDEGLAHVERLPFARTPLTRYAAKGALVAAAALSRPGWKDAVTTADPGASHLVFDWNPEGIGDRLDAAVSRISEVVTGPVDRALCPHPAGPPVCWCRPPLPGLVLAFVQTREIDLARSILVGVTPADRTLANTLGATFVQV